MNEHYEVSGENEILDIYFFFLFPLKIFFLQKDWKEIQLKDLSKKI